MHLSLYVEQAPEHSLADIEQRAEHLHLQRVGTLENAVASCEKQAAGREQALLEELIAAQRHYTTNDARLRRELEESQQARISDALDVQLRENAYAQRLQEEASRAMLESQHELVQQFQSNFEQYRLRTQEEHRATVLELQAQNEELQDRLESAERASEKSLERYDSATPKGKPVQAPSTPEPQNTSSVPSAPKGPLFSMPEAIPWCKGTVREHEPLSNHNCASPFTREGS